MAEQDQTITPEELADELLQRITRQFARVCRPSQITKTVARAIDDEWHLTERRRALLYSRDLETKWEQLTGEEIESHYDIFAFLDAEGYLFYLPAFMSHVLRNYPQVSQGNAVDWTIYACTHSCEDFRLFNPGQMRCVIDFLTLCAVAEDFCDSHSAARAVDLLEICPNARYPA